MFDVQGSMSVSTSNTRSGLLASPRKLQSIQWTGNALTTLPQYMRNTLTF